MLSDPIILSDEEEESRKTPLPSLPKKPRTGPEPIPTIFLLDDDPTPVKPGPAAAAAAFSSSSTPSIVPDTPMSELSLVKCTAAASSSSIPSVVPDTPMSDLSLVKCTAASSVPQLRVIDCAKNLAGDDGLICLESDNDDDLEGGSRKEVWKDYESVGGVDYEMEEISRSMGSMDTFMDANVSQMDGDVSSQPTVFRDDIDQEIFSSTIMVHNHPEKENFSLESISNSVKHKITEDNSDNKSNADKAACKKKMTKEERIRILEEKKLKKEEEKLQKAALKAQAAELKKMEKEMQKWEKGKFALKSIVAEVDTKVVEQGSVGGHLLTRFAEKGLTYRITSNPIERSIVWTMSIPESISRLSPERNEVQYVLLVYGAEEFCSLISNESIVEHVSGVRSRYPSYTICYLTNRLMAYISKREKELYKNPENDNGWRRPPIEEVLARLTTHFVSVHNRQCRDEAELAEHVVGLTCSLASCQFRKKLTRLSVNANGSLIPKDFIDKNLIKKSPWLKALIAIPKVQPRFAIAIWKKYPTMKSLLRVYMDPTKSVHEKEFLLEDLTTEGLLGGERRVGHVCSKRVYRILMAQSGSIKTDDVEDGADFFSHH